MTLLALLLFASFPGDEDADAPAKRAAEIEAKTLKGLTSISRGTGRIKVERLEYIVGEKEKERRNSRELKFAFDVPSFRIEDVLERETTILTNERFLQFHNRGRRAVHLGPGGMLGEKPRLGVFDPRLVWCGTAHIGPLHTRSGFDFYFHRKDVVRSRVGTDRVGGRDLLWIEREFQGGQIWKRWVDPNCAYGTVRLETKGSGRGMNWVSETEFDLKKWGKHWFPERIKTTRRIKGLKQVEGDFMTVWKVEFHDVELNKAVDPELFRISSLGIPAGTPIQESPRPRELRKWDGKKIVPSRPR